MTKAEDGSYTVGELVTELLKHDQNLKVYYSDFEQGPCDVLGVALEKGYTGPGDDRVIIR